MVKNANKPFGWMVSNPEAFSLGGNKPKSNNYFAFHSFRVTHLQLVLEVLVGDPPVVNDIAGLKRIKNTGWPHPKQ